MDYAPPSLSFIAAGAYNAGAPAKPTFVLAGRREFEVEGRVASHFFVPVEA
jgi:hypothetical protein